MSSMFSKKFGQTVARLARSNDACKLIRFSSFGKPTWPEGSFPPPGSVPPPNLYPPCTEPKPSPGYHTPPGYQPPVDNPECPPQCCTPPGCMPPCCPPTTGDRPELCEDCRGRRRICPPPCCYPGPIPYNPCCPRFPKTDYKKYKRLVFFVFLPMMILAALNAFGNEHCPKGPCREWEFMRRRTKRFPWGDGNESFFHNEHVNHLPGECEPPPMICYPDPQSCD